LRRLRQHSGNAWFRTHQVLSRETLGCAQDLGWLFTPRSRAKRRKVRRQAAER
jgi:hypothetical protein